MDRERRKAATVANRVHAAEFRGQKMNDLAVAKQHKQKHKDEMKVASSVLLWLSRAQHAHGRRRSTTAASIFRRNTICVLQTFMNYSKGCVQHSTKAVSMAQITEPFSFTVAKLY